MTPKLRLERERFELKNDINRLLGLGDAITNEQRSEMATATKRLDETAIEYRAALASEGADESRAIAKHGEAGADGESAERRALLDSVSIGDYLGPAANEHIIEGRAAELNQAFDMELRGQEGGVRIPWHVLETRAFTTTTQNDGSVIQRPILQRLFARSVAESLGVRMDQVPVGRQEFNIIASTLAPVQTKEGSAVAAPVAATFATATLKPRRLPAAYEVTHESLASVAEIEQTLRRDLFSAVTSAMSNIIINGAAPTTNAPQNVQGFLAAITAPEDAGETATFADYAGAHATAVDGIHAEMESEVSSVIGVDVYKHAATIYQAGSGESGSEALKRRSMMCRSSSYIPSATNAVQSKGNLFHLAGPNGGGPMRGDSVGCVFNGGPELVRDRYTKASIGILLTLILTWDLKAAFRPEAYSRQAFKIT